MDLYENIEFPLIIEGESVIDNSEKTPTMSIRFPCLKLHGIIPIGESSPQKKKFFRVKLFRFFISKSVLPNYFSVTKRKITLLDF